MAITRSLLDVIAVVVMRTIAYRVHECATLSVTSTGRLSTCASRDCSTVSATVREHACCCCGQSYKVQTMQCDAVSTVRMLKC
jgi:hypothetical protein